MRGGEIAQELEIEMLPAPRRPLKLIASGECSNEFNWHRSTPFGHVSRRAWSANQELCQFRELAENQRNFAP